MIQYSFLLVNYNMAGLTQNLVASLIGDMPADSAYEILIADNSDDPAKALPDSPEIHGVPVMILRVGNRGYVDALNRLIPLAQGAMVMISHPDIEFRVGAIAQLATFLATHPRAGIVSPDLYYPDGAPCRIRLRFPTVATEARRLANMILSVLAVRRRLRDEVLWDRSADVEVETVMSVCMLFRREALQSAGLIDQRLVFYHANDYLSGMVRRHGWSCHYTLGARVIHYERFAPRHLYGEGAEMTYKRSPIAAQPRMRADFFAFLSSFYGITGRIAIRVISLAEDGIQLAAQFKHPRERWQDIRRLWQSVLIDIGLS